MFSPEEFLDMQVTDANDTKIVPVPVGEYLAVADKVDVRRWAKKDDPSVSGMALDILWSIDDQSVKDFLGREKVTVKQGIMLDINEGQGLDMSKGKNVGLGRLREALNMNTPGQPFSFSRIQGNVAKIAVTHREHNGDLFAEVKAVARPA